MRKTISKILAFLPASLIATVSLVGCGGSDSDTVVLRVLNSADYIYEEDEPENYDDDCDYNSYFLDDEGNYKADMMDQFVDYMEEVYGQKVSYVYDTFDTNETMYNELMTGKSSYDIIVTSDYMVQKLISYDLIQPISEKGDYTDNDEVKSIHENVSDYLWDIFDGIHPKNKDNNAPLDDVISKYSVPYMWGTVGVMYNPEFYSELETDDVIDLFSSWEALYSEETKNTFSIKDSVRDVYAVSVVHAFYESDIKPLEEKLASDASYTEAQFNKDLNDIFNRCDNETLEIIKEDMLALKANSFGFEVDSGKTDMVEGKVGANLAWSGDATWAITEAEMDYEKELYFSIPEEGSNIWFDAFCIPTVSENKDVAVKFIDFMSQPTQAIQNMWSVGYTSAVNGPEILDYIYENYDVRGQGLEGDELTEALANADGTYDLTYFFEGSIDVSKVSELTGVNYDMVLLPIEGVVGRTLTAQFPEAKDLSHLCVMDDFGTQNEAVLDMWEHVRTNSLPIYALIILIIEFVAALALILYFAIKKRIRKNLQKQYRQERNQNN